MSLQGKCNLSFLKNLRVQIIPILIFKLLGQIISGISKSNKCTMQVHAIIWNHKLRLISDQNCTQLSPILWLHYIHFHYQWKCKVKFWEQKLQNWPHNGFLCLSISFNFFGNFSYSVIRHSFCPECQEDDSVGK